MEIVKFQPEHGYSAITKVFEKNQCLGYSKGHKITSYFLKFKHTSLCIRNVIFTTYLSLKFNDNLTV